MCLYRASLLLVVSLTGVGSFRLKWSITKDPWINKLHFLVSDLGH